MTHKVSSMKLVSVLFTTLLAVFMMGANATAQQRIQIREYEDALMFASREGHEDVVKALLAQGTNVNAQNNRGATALMGASCFGNVEMVKMLITEGADVNAKANDGMTALMFASRDGHVEIVKMLLAKGADVNAKDNDGNTALDLAKAERQLQSPQIVKLLENYKSPQQQVKEKMTQKTN